MAAFGGTFSLSGRGDCIGVSAGRSEEHVTCSFASGTVELYDVHLQSCLRSWSLPSSARLTCPASYHPSGQRYLAAQNDTELLCWSETSERMDHLLHRHTSTIHSIIPTHHHCLTLHTNGTVMALGAEGVVGEEVELVANQVLGISELKYLAAQPTECPGGGVALLAVLEHKKIVRVVVCGVQRDRLDQPMSAGVEVEGGVLSCCVCGHQLIFLSKDKNLMSFDLRPFYKPSPPPLLPSLWQRRPPSPLPSSPLPPSPLHLAAMSPSYFALASGSQTLCLVDSMYGTVQSEAPDPGPGLRQLCHIGGFLFVLGDSVRVCEVRCGGEGTLRGALGRAEASARSRPIISAWGDPEIDSRAVKKQRKRSMKELAAMDETPTIASLSKMLSGHTFTPGLDYGAVLSRLLEEKARTRKPLVALLESQCLPASCHGDIVMEALQRHDWILISEALPFIDDLPEAVIVRLISTLLSLPEQIQKTISRDQLLLAVLSYPYNDIQLQHPLAALPFPDVLALLRFLHGVIATPSSPVGAEGLPHRSALEWAGLLLDVHLPQLLLSTDARQLLRELQGGVAAQVKQLSQAGSLQTMLSVAASNAWRRSETHDWTYRLQAVPMDF